MEKSEAATNFFELALRSSDATSLVWTPLIVADAINHETLRIVARRLLDAFQAGHQFDPAQAIDAGLVSVSGSGHWQRSATG